VDWIAVDGIATGAIALADAEDSPELHVTLPHLLHESARAVPHQVQGQLRQAASLQALQIPGAM